MMKKRRLWPVSIVAALIIVVLLLVLKGRGVIGDAGNIKVAVGDVQAKNIVETVSASGKIYPETEVKIKSDVSGEIVMLSVAEGDSVKMGQVLLKINPSIYASAVTQAEASMQQSRSGVVNAKELVAQAQAQMARTKANFDRNKELFAGRVISRMEYEQSEAEYLSAKANFEAAEANVVGGRFGVTGAQANLLQARENLRRTTITAPTSGIISQLLVKNGERVVGTAQMDGTQVLTIADMGRMELRVDVSETDINRVSIGDTSLIEVDAYTGKIFKGIVSKISVSSVQLNSATSATNSDQATTYTVHIFMLPESYRQLITKGNFPFKPGMSAGVEIRTHTEYGVLAIPINAVTTRDYPDDKTKKSGDNQLTNPIRQVVFVVEEKMNSVVLRDVKTGIQDNEYIQIVSGLKKGDKVVVAPYGAIARQLKDGAKIKVVRQDQLFGAQSEH